MIRVSTKLPLRLFEDFVNDCEGLEGVEHLVLPIHSDHSLVKVAQQMEDTSMIFRLKSL